MLQAKITRMQTVNGALLISDQRSDIFIEN